MSYYTDSAKLQQEIELAIDKRSGRKFGPPQGYRAVFFLDDLNLPFVETYGTQSAIALLTQHLQYGDWFDRGDLVRGRERDEREEGRLSPAPDLHPSRIDYSQGMRKEIVDTQYLAAMNPTAGELSLWLGTLHACTDANPSTTLRQAPSRSASGRSGTSPPSPAPCPPSTSTRCHTLAIIHSNHPHLF